jgi:hypothetical protein
MKSFKQFLESVNQPAFNYGNKGYQDELEKIKKKKETEKQKKRKTQNDSLYNERKHGRGIRATENGIKGWIKDKVFSPGDW